MNLKQHYNKILLLATNNMNFYEELLQLLVVLVWLYMLMRTTYESPSVATPMKEAPVESAPKKIENNYPSAEKKERKRSFNKRSNKKGDVNVVTVTTPMKEKPVESSRKKNENNNPSAEKKAERKSFNKKSPKKVDVMIDLNDRLRTETGIYWELVYSIMATFDNDFDQAKAYVYIMQQEMVHRLTRQHFFEPELARALLVDSQWNYDGVETAVLRLRHVCIT